MTIYRLNDLEPDIDKSALVSREAVLIGNVQVGRDVSIWPGAVLRGDNEPISIAECSNLQDGCVVHTDPGFPITIGKNVTVGHLAMLHGCTIGEGALVGMNATILNGAEIGANSIVGAGSLVTSNKKYPPRSLIVGSPAKVIRTLSDEEVKSATENSLVYVSKIKIYKDGLQEVVDS